MEKEVSRATGETERESRTTIRALPGLGSRLHAASLYPPSEFSKCKENTGNFKY